VTFIKSNLSFANHQHIAVSRFQADFREIRQLPRETTVRRIGVRVASLSALRCRPKVIPGNRHIPRKIRNAWRHRSFGSDSKMERHDHPFVVLAEYRHLPTAESMSE
jgi:hypothetical protein